ncbi:PIH1 domain-containing protein 1 [Eupeodes corollae]|uniref:PIH1 domain-containing protein 1 n=1 Tax=Eupeodes corollae TaxID=290404 RepID=UPI0024906292|nr:PIH1 domain-containing protein 1 [Eupeodes corollae]
MAKPKFLEADETAFDNNLKIVKNEVEDELEKLFGSKNAQKTNNVTAPPRDFKVVTPKPGFCIKSFKVNTNEKYFINVCHTDEIPPPEDITEEELTGILQTDEPSSYRIPMSISEPRITKDKSNNPCDACDIAVNPKFFYKIEKSILFKDFFLALIAEALSDKYNIQIKVDKCIILTKRKFIGTLVSHRIRNNDVKTVLDTYKNPSSGDRELLEKLNSNLGTKTKPLIQEISENELNQMKIKSEELKMNSTKIKEEISLAASTVPEFKLRAKVKGQNVDEVQAELYMPKCISSSEIVLNVGEDRILVESMKHGYLFDKFVNYKLDQDRVNAVFDKTNKMLQVRVSVVAG